MALNRLIQQANDVSSVVRIQLIAGCKSDNEGKVVAVDDDGKILVSSVTAPVSSILEFGESTSIASGALTTVLSFTNALTTNAYIDSIVVTGSTLDSEFQLVINGSTKGKFSTSEQDRTKPIPLDAFILAPSDILSIKGIHFRTGLLGDFAVTLIGHRTA